MPLHIEIHHAHISYFPVRNGCDGESKAGTVCFNHLPTNIFVYTANMYQYNLIYNAMTQIIYVIKVVFEFVGIIWFCVNVVGL